MLPIGRLKAGRDQLRGAENSLRESAGDLSPYALFQAGPDSSDLGFRNVQGPQGSGERRSLNITTLSVKDCADFSPQPHSKRTCQSR